MRKALTLIGGESSNINYTRLPPQKQSGNEISSEDTVLNNESSNDLSGLVPYQYDIYNYLKSIEMRHTPMQGYVTMNPKIASHMRPVLVDWLIDVCNEFGFNTETLFKTVLYVDRSTNHLTINRNTYQLLGVASLLISSKIEEVDIPDIDDLVSISDGAYTKPQLLSMEKKLLNVLEYNLTSPTIFTFIEHIATILKYSDIVKNIACVFAEYAILRGIPFINMKPSLVASASLANARVTLDKKSKIWPMEISVLTGYSLADVSGLIFSLKKNLENVKILKLTAILDKYRTKEKYFVSKMFEK